MSSLLSKSLASLSMRARVALPAQYANYVTASAVVYAAKAKKASAPKKAKGQSNSFRKKAKGGDGEGEGGSGGSGRLNEKYYKPAIPVKVEEFLPSSASTGNIGRVMGFPANVQPSLELATFPTLLKEQFALIKPPALAVREPTISLLEKLDNAMQKPSSENRMVLTGETGSGKSALLMQAVSHCMSAGWVVIYVPNATSWVNSSFAYNKVGNTTNFVQPLLASQIAGQVAKNNKSILSKLKLSSKVKVGRHDMEQGTTLFALLEQAVKDQYSAQDAMEILLKELSAQKEVPTLIAVDEVNALYKPTQYLDPKAKELDPEQLLLPRLFLNYISGKASLGQGAVVAATSESLIANQSLALHVALGVKQVSPYTKLSESIMSWTTGLTNIPVPAYTRAEAKGVFDYYKKGNIIYDAPTEDLFVNRFITSNGNPRKFFTACAKGI
ncbi:37S ribosomal protein S23 mitochondrial [Actinomortierella ambigua]|nr:37S ribosomal protein S23 mitochondrial [Actinomortierella ambigua]